MDVTTLQCSGQIEWLNGNKMIAHRVKCSTMTIRILRNELRDLFLEIDSSKGKHKFQMIDVTIHKKFAIEGKATFNFSRNNVVVMVSNAPTGHLIPFLKTLVIKMTSKKQSPKTNIRQHLLSNKSHLLEEISPINSKDVRRVKDDVGLKKITAAHLKRKKHLEEDDVNQKRKCVMSLAQHITLNEDQQEIVQSATSKKNIFFTGSAGTGKSYLLKYVISILPPNETVVTASTGAAASLISGVTLHSFAGIGGGDIMIERAIELASRPSSAQIWRKCKYLVIDEISMIDGEYFEKIEEVARRVRKNDEPFGGIKLILCGDFLQLPPVNKTSKARFCFQTEAWTRCQFLCFNLKKVYRQNDDIFIDILNNIRLGRITDEISRQLAATSKNILEKDGIIPTQLCCKTVEAQLINQNKLSQLKGTEKTFVAVDNGPEKLLDEQTSVVKTLVLKQGAQVMLLKNINVSIGLVNGARGTVASFTSDGLPVVQFCSGLKRTIEMEKWVIKAPNNAIVTRRQIPLRLAWAFSVHKSQGLTLDCVEMSLSGVFEAGQAYVALSRAQSLNALRVRDFDPKYVWANPDVLKFYRILEFDQDAKQLRKLG